MVFPGFGIVSTSIMMSNGTTILKAWHQTKVQQVYKMFSMLSDLHARRGKNLRASSIRMIFFDYENKWQKAVLFGL